MFEKKYRVEGNTLIINDGVTTIDKADFHYLDDYGALLLYFYDENNNICFSIKKELENIKKVIIPDSVTSIGEYAFYWCKSLTSITIPDGVTNIGGGAFQGCESLTSITIPSSVTNIGDAAFAFCTNLENITIPNSVTSIGVDAFHRLTDCKKPTITCDKGSYAEKYAKKNNIPVKHIKDKSKAIERE